MDSNSWLSGPRPSHLPQGFTLYLQTWLDHKSIIFKLANHLLSVLSISLWIVIGCRHHLKIALLIGQICYFEDKIFVIVKSRSILELIQISPCNSQAKLNSSWLKISCVSFFNRRSRESSVIFCPQPILFEAWGDFVPPIF